MRILFRIFRILLLLSIFIALAFYAKTQKLKSRSWSKPLQVVIYPINTDSSSVVEAYINQLDDTVFDEIDNFFQKEAGYFSLITSQPTITRVGVALFEHPPTPPKAPANFAEIAWWGVKFRYWAYRNTPDDESNLHRVRIFVHYHEALEGKKLQHSLGLDKGLLAIVHAFASENQEQQNNIVIAHEFLHTVGASDKYSANNQPIFPHGYAEPDNHPLFPQVMAEIMAAKIPLSETQSKMAENLDQCVIGDKTAEEINWVQQEIQE